MKITVNLEKGSRSARSPFNIPIKSIVFGALFFAGVQTLTQAQATAPAKPATPAQVAAAPAAAVQYSRPSWWFGVAAGGNLNFYRGTTQQLNGDLFAPKAFGHGNGLGLYLAPLVEFHRPDSRWGAMLQIGYDDRRGKFDQVTTPCNCPADLSTGLSYITVEPSLRVAPFKGNFYLYGGPRLAFNASKSFTYEQGPNPLIAGQASTEVKGDFSDINSPVISMQIGAGYDIPVNSQTKHTQYVISPFIAFHPDFGQRVRSVETWDNTTIRIGAAFKFGRGKKVSNATELILVERVLPQVKFSVYAPKNVPVERRVRETFPLRNYVFFDEKNNEISDRYVLLNKDQVKDFKEDQLEVFTPKRLSGRSDRGMEVYYNVLNILGDRMGKNPSSTIVLVGSSGTTSKDGLAMAESVKRYLVEVFGIKGDRIHTEGRKNPKIKSGTAGDKKDVKLAGEGNRRVSVESKSPALLMEFESGKTPAKPISFTVVQKAPIDSYVVFNVEGAKEAFASWSLEITNEKGELQNFGPYTEERVALPGKSILGTTPSGDYKVVMVGKTFAGDIVKKEASVHMVLWTPGTLEEGLRYSVIYEFDVAKVNSIYVKYLNDVVTPKIPVGGTVIIHGHTDIIGDKEHNKVLSLKRANNVRAIIETALAKANRKDVKFEIHGFGEDSSVSPYDNKYPEERFYNRAVIIDIIPKN